MSSRTRRNVVASVLALAALLVGGEVAWRWLLFSPSADGLALAAWVRRPELYGSARGSDLHWELRARLAQRDAWHAPEPPHDEWLGWTSERFEPGSYEHRDERSLGARRPLLFLGNAFTQCATEDSDCYQGLLEETPFAPGFALLNYGVRGYGLDQTALLLDKLLERERQRDDDPIYLIGVLVDDDLDRCALSMRTRPKPRLELRGGRAERVPGRVPTLAEFLADSPVWRSWMFAALSGVTRVDQDAAVRELARATLSGMLDRLQAAGVPHMFVLYYASVESVLDPARTGWRDALLREVLDARATPFVDLAREMREQAQGDPDVVAQWFGGHPQYEGYYNPGGNRVVFASLLEALCEQLELRGPQPLPSVEHMTRVDSPGGPAFARYRVGLQEPFSDPADARRLMVRVHSEGPTSVHYELRGLVREFRARVRIVSHDASAEGSIGVQLVADGVQLASLVVRDGEPPREVQVDLSGRSTLELRCDDAGDGVRGDRAVFASPEFVLVEH